MNKFRHLFLFCFIICLGNIQAENSVDLFFERLQESQNGASVRIIQDAGVVSKMRERQENTLNENTNVRTVAGFRVQVFSSNTPRTAKTEAFRIESELKNNLASAPVYVSFTAPFWKVRVGDCRNYQEAVDLMNKLKNEFPKHKNSMFIVRENIKLTM